MIFFFKHKTAYDIRISDWSAHVCSSDLTQLQRAIAATVKLRALGVAVVFVQLPNAGHYAISEPDVAPRALTWDMLIQRSGAIGLHFVDHPQMQGYYRPECSHMTASEADRFTPQLYQLIQRALAARTAAGEQP